MHKCISDILDKANIKNDFNDYYLLIDGNDFKPYGRLQE